LEKLAACALEYDFQYRKKKKEKQKAKVIEFLINCNSQSLKTFLVKNCASSTQFREALCDFLTKGNISLSECVK